MADCSPAPAPTLLFVYGTLMRGAENHAQLADQTYIAPARTASGFQLYQLDGYPGMVRDATVADEVEGEVWAVGPAALERLDGFEGVPEGLYTREPISLAAPFDQAVVQSYLYARSVAGRKLLGRRWTVG